jgi:hypothetical protein
MNCRNFGRSALEAIDTFNVVVCGQPALMWCNVGGPVRASYS